MHKLCTDAFHYLLSVQFSGCPFALQLSNFASNGNNNKDRLNAPPPAALYQWRILCGVESDCACGGFDKWFVGTSGGGRYYEVESKTVTSYQFLREHK